MAPSGPGKKNEHSVASESNSEDDYHELKKSTVGDKDWPSMKSIGYDNQ